jgi:hypothetical protein
MRRKAYYLVISLVLLAAGAAAAQTDGAQAEHLFREGKKLMAEGKYKSACDAFEGSYKKDPAVTTLMNLADCREKNEQYASAWGNFVEVGRQTARDAAMEGLHKSALQRASALEPRLSYLIINVPDDARVEGLTITRNGVEVDALEWNRDIPVDGGTYAIEGKAPAYEAWSTTVTVANFSDKQSVNVPRFHEALDSVETDGGEVRSGGSSKLAIGLWAVGAVALGGGLVFELKSGGTYDDAKASPDNAERHELTDQANSERRIGMALAGAGVVAVGVGTYVWFSRRHHADASGVEEEDDDDVTLAPSIDRGRAGLVVMGRF